MVDRNNKNIIFSLQGIGNTILSLPLAQAIKKTEQESSVHLLVRSPRIKDLCIRHPAVDEVIVAGKSKLSILMRIRNEKYSRAVFSFPAGVRSHLLAWLAGIPIRVGHTLPGRRSLALTETADYLSNAHDLLQNMELAKAVNLDADLDKLWPPLAHVPDEFMDKAAGYLSEHGIDPGKGIIGIHTGSDPEFHQKRYPPALFAKVAGILYDELGLPAVVFDGPSEFGTGRLVAQSTDTPVHPLDGWGDMTDAWGLLSFCRVFVSNDSGLMNLAAAAGVPTVAVFGPSEVHRTKPFKGIAVRSPAECAPCFSLSKYPGCPKGKPDCMETVPPEEVARAALEVVGR